MTRADYIILDPPYCGIVTGQYSDLKSDLANMPPHQWRKAMRVVARRLRDAQIKGGRCTVIVPNRRELADGQRLLFPEMVRRIWSSCGYQLYDVVYSSRRIQRRQGRRIAILNNHARRSRVPLADISEVLTFCGAINGRMAAAGKSGESRHRPYKSKWHGGNRQGR